MYVLVTTNNRGVYFGKLVENEGPEYVVLEHARCCVRWDCEDDGFLYLAHKGPAGVAQVSPAVESLVVFGVATLALCTAEAVEGWYEA